MRQGFQPLSDWEFDLKLTPMGKMPTLQEKFLYCGMGVPPVLKMVQELSSTDNF